MRMLIPPPDLPYNPMIEAAGCIIFVLIPLKYGANPDKSRIKMDCMYVPIPASKSKIW